MLSTLNFQKYNIAAVIPCYRVEREIQSVLHGLPKYIKHIIVVDDASPDSTSEIVAAVAKKDKRITLIRHESNLGVGGAMVTGFRKALAAVKTGDITVAVRNVEIDGVNVKEGQVIALLDGKLVASSNSVEEAVALFLEKANAAEHELITFYSGQDMPRAEANRIADVMRKKYSEQDIEVQEGGQEHYQFIISIE